VVLPRVTPSKAPIHVSEKVKFQCFIEENNFSSEVVSNDDWWAKKRWLQVINAYKKIKIQIIFMSTISAIQD
jgi:hypothetical protein